MKPLLLRLALLALAAVAPVWLAAAPAKPSKPGAKPSPEAATGFARTQARIDTLLKQRLNPTPLPDEMANPFTLPGTAPAPGPARPVAPAATDDAEILARLVTQLKIAGFVQIGDVPRIIINQLSYKEGDTLAIRGPADGVRYLRVKHIDPPYFTLELNGVEQTIKL